MAASPSPSLSVPGGTSYSSNTMHVGDGTWDAATDTFLLPNIMGLNFATMRYNGMGNRFRALQEYHTLIIAHGVIAAITFLFIVPAAILIASFYHRNPRFALRMHITLQTLTVILTTIIFVLGYFAVGPERSLTNPHHGIGLAIYLLILYQAISGWIIKKIEKGKKRYHIPIKLMLHQWLGRGIALLAFAQIPVGLTLYGSPASLFVLYTLWMFTLVVTYFVLTYRNHVRAAGGYDEGSYVTATHSSYTDDGRRRHSTGNRRLEEVAGAVGLGAALAALRRRRSSGRHERYDSRTELTGPHSGHHPAPSGSIVDDKFTESDYVSNQHTWRNRLLGAGAGAGGMAAARKLFKRRREREDEYIDDGYQSQVGAYRPPLGGNQPPMTQSQIHLAQMEGGYGVPPGYNPAGGPPAQEGEAPGVTLADGAVNQHGSTDWARVERQEAAQQAALRHRDHSPDGSENSYSTYQTQQGKSFFGKMTALPASVAAAGGLAAFWRSRRQRKEQEAVEAQRRTEIEQERIFRAAHAPYSDDSPIQPNRPARGGRVGSNSPMTVRTGSPTRSRRHSNNTAMDNNTLHPPPPMPPGGSASNLASTSQVHQTQQQTNLYPNATSVPPPPRSTRQQPPPHSPAATSSPYSTPTRSLTGHQHPYDVTTPPPPRGLRTVHSSSSPLTPPAAATAASASLLSPPPRAAQPPSPLHRPTSTSSPHAGGGVESPPVSVKVKMHNDGRHVTLRRLNEEEAALERERAARQAYAGQAVGGSSPSGYETGGTGTDVTDFESNRRRRRAERARAEMERARAAEGGGAGGGKHVEFT